MKKTITIMLITLLMVMIVGCNTAAPEVKENKSTPIITKMSPEDALKWMKELPEPKPNKPYKLGVPLVHVADPLWVGFEYGIREEAKKLGLPDPIFTSAGGYTKADVQISQTEDMLAKGIDGLLLAPANPDSLIPVAEEAINLGVPVINFAISLNSSSLNIVTDVEVENTRLGESMAKYLGDELKGKGKVLLLPGVSGTSWSIGREKGFMDYVKAHYPEIEIIGKQYTESSRSKALAVTEDMLHAHPDINGIMTASDLIGAGASDAVRAIGKQGKITIVTTPGISTETESLIKSKDITVSAAYPAVEEGRWLVKLMVHYLNGNKDIPKQIPLPIENIDINNLATIDLSQYRAPAGYTPGK